MTTATDPEILSNWFGMDDILAEKVSNYAKLHQLCVEIDKCDHLPAQVSLMKCQSKLPKLDQLVLAQQYRAFLGTMEAYLVCAEDLSMEVNTWLYSLESEEGFQIVKNYKNIPLTFLDQEPMTK